MPEEATLDAFVTDDDEDCVKDDVAADPDADTTSEASVDTDTTPATEERVDSDADTASATEESPDTDTERDRPETDERSVEPSPVTSSWSGDEAVCPSCGEPAARLWQDGPRRVCAACKPWTRTGEDACDQ